MKPLDISKFRKHVNKTIPGISLGFNDPKTYISTGCYALNYLISNGFNKGIPLEGKFTMFAGDSGSGKSYIATANVIKDCQRQGIFPIVIDTENALDESWMQALGVDTSEDKMEKGNAASVDDLAKYLVDFVDQYTENYETVPYIERPRVVIIIDSLGMLITPTQIKQAGEGNMVGDMGIKAKQITHMMRVALAKIAVQPIGLIATNHVFAAQDKYSPDQIPGGKMLEFASSVIVQMNKYLLKEDEDGKLLVGGQVVGIRSTAVVRKSRYAKPFERIKIDIPYDRGMDAYSGLFDLFLKKDVIKKSGSRYEYTSPVTGEVFLDWRKNFKKIGLLDTIMNEWDHWENNSPVGFSEEEEGNLEDE